MNGSTASGDSDPDDSDPKKPDDSPEPKSTKARSETPYPYFGLLKVMDIVRAVQRAGGNEAAPATAVQKELGLTKTTDRVWAYGIPSTILFGLIERTGRGDDAQLNLTLLGRCLALPGTPDEERRTKAAAIRTPELYQGLLEKFAGHPVPTKDVLKRILQRDFKILESMAGNAADAFLESVTFAELVTPSGTLASLGGDSDSRAPLDAAPADASPSAPAAGTILVAVPQDYIIYRCKITQGRILDLPLPPNFTRKDAKRIHNFLLTQVDDVDDEKKEAEED